MRRDGGSGQASEVSFVSRCVVVIIPVKTTVQRKMRVVVVVASVWKLTGPEMEVSPYCTWKPLCERGGTLLGGGVTTWGRVG